jgi:hypothetical protein
MGAHLDTKNLDSPDINKAEKQLENTNKELAFELTQAAVDVAGIVDPTPISDVVGGAMSLMSGDLIGAGLSLISIVPYVGDALGKTTKAARSAKKIAALRERVLKLTTRVNNLKVGQYAKRTRRKAAKLIRKKRVDEAVKRKNCKNCANPTNEWGVRLPDEGSGTWKGKRGDGEWTPPDPAKIDNPKEAKRLKKLINATDGKPIKYNDGYPDFSGFICKHKGDPVKVEVEMVGDPTDFTRANNAMKKKYPGWKQPKDTTWHHKEDGVTMELVPYDIHGNVPHTGGASIVKDADY